MQLFPHVIFFALPLCTDKITIARLVSELEADTTDRTAFSEGLKGPLRVEAGRKSKRDLTGSPLHKLWGCVNYMHF